MPLKYEFSPQVSLLLVNASHEKVQMQYDSNPFTWSMPKIGPRPPFYTNPLYGWNYPVL